MSHLGDAYVGSSMDLWRRLFTQHKNAPGKGSVKHKLFYNYVREHTWSNMNLSIFQCLPNHIAVYQAMHPYLMLKEDEMRILVLLNMYHMALVEQFYLDHICPSLNFEPLANASSWNAGATGMIRDELFRSNLSQSYMGRTYSQATIEKHRSAMTGLKLSDATRAKMSASANGVDVFIMDATTKLVTTFSTKTAACAYLGVSQRTLTR